MQWCFENQRGSDRLMNGLMTDLDTIVSNKSVQLFTLKMATLTVEINVINYVWIYNTWIAMQREYSFLKYILHMTRAELPTSLGSILFATTIQVNWISNHRINIFVLVNATTDNISLITSTYVKERTLQMSSWKKKCGINQPCKKQKLM
jgi:hypothetical protein